MKERITDQKKYGNLKLTVGIIFVLHGIALFILSAPPVEAGFLLNNIMLLLDIAWMLVGGGILIVLGLLALSSKTDTIETIFMTGMLMIYTIVLIISSIIFNALAAPHFQSYGRVISYTLQVTTRLFNPTFSIDFFIALFSFIIVLIISVLFKKYVNNLST